MTTHAAAIAALTLPLSAATTELQILPAGKFRGQDGRPSEVPNWYIDRAVAERLIARVNARKNPIVTDYEHQTLLAAENGQPAPASAWFKKLEWRDGSGLWATDVEWTPRAAAMIASREYRFYSPVILYSKKTGEVLNLLHGGITNNPAIDGMTDLAGRAAARFSITTEVEMTALEALNKALAALGLKPADTESAAQAALVAYHAAATTQGTELVALKASVATKDTEIAALKATSPDPAKYVAVDTMKTLQDQVAALTAQIGGREVEEVVTAALSDGRLLAGQEAWARELGKSNIDALKKYIETAKPIAALKSTQTGGKQPAADKDAPLSEAELAACKNMGLNPEDYKKTKLSNAA